MLPILAPDSGPGSGDVAPPRGGSFFAGVGATLLPVEARAAPLADRALERTEPHSIDGPRYNCARSVGCLDRKNEADPVRSLARVLSKAHEIPVDVIVTVGTPVGFAAKSPFNRPCSQR